MERERERERERETGGVRAIKLKTCLGHELSTLQRFAKAFLRQADLFEGRMEERKGGRKEGRGAKRE
jgi:hypothetical protein